MVNRLHLEHRLDLNPEDPLHDPADGAAVFRGQDRFGRQNPDFTTLTGVEPLDDLNGDLGREGRIGLRRGNRADGRETTDKSTSTRRCRLALEPATATLRKARAALAGAGPRQEIGYPPGRRRVPESVSHSQNCAFFQSKRGFDKRKGKS
jgi:hypothetical protein